MCTVASAPAAFRVRGWQITLEVAGHPGGDRRRSGLMLTILPDPMLTFIRLHPMEGKAHTFRAEAKDGYASHGEPLRAGRGWAGYAGADPSELRTLSVRD